MEGRKPSGENKTVLMIIPGISLVPNNVFMWLKKGLKTKINISVQNISGLSRPGKIEQSSRDHKIIITLIIIDNSQHQLCQDD